MASADQIKALVRSHSEKDDARFYAVTMQVAAHAARRGHSKLAQELRDLVDEARSKASAMDLRPGGPIPVARPKGELAGLLTVHYPETRLTDMVLNEDLAERLDRVIGEQMQRERLRAHGFLPARRLLLVGPPGTGKTMTASALAGDLGLPLFTIRLDGLITKFMGETASKLRLVFEAAESTRGVYLFDEIDALGGERTLGNDVGEIRRVLNSFLQFLENHEADSLVIGTTNHPALLDRALFRRFDMVMDYEQPTKAIAVAVMKARLALIETRSIDWSQAARAADGLSHAEITSACEQAAKDSILGRDGILRTKGLVVALQERRATSATR
jgi:SpoVK/Ycf46/Vps4 family AAA+-type ATPase